jgi:hypothetical protein
MRYTKRGDTMSLAEKLIGEFNELPDDEKQEVIDFVEFLKQRKDRDISNLMDEIIDDNIEALKELAK